MVGHTISPRTWEAEAGRPLWVWGQSVWCTKYIPGQPGLHGENLTQKRRRTEQSKKEEPKGKEVFLDQQLLSPVHHGWCLSVRQAPNGRILDSHEAITRLLCWLLFRTVLQLTPHFCWKYWYWGSMNTAVCELYTQISSIYKAHKHTNSAFEYKTRHTRLQAENLLPPTPASYLMQNVPGIMCFHLCVTWETSEITKETLWQELGVSFLQEKKSVLLE